MEGRAYPWLEVKEPTITELAERVAAAEKDAAFAKRAAADALQSAVEAGKRLRMVGQIDARIAKDVRTMRVATAVVLACSILIVAILLAAWCLR